MDLIEFYWKVIKARLIMHFWTETTHDLIVLNK